MSVFKDYMKLTEQYQKEYGPRTIVLYQIGNFYELYSINEKLINLKEITELLNIQMTRKNKSLLEVNESNYNMAGIPIFTLNKYLKVLTNANYTVIVVDQNDDNPSIRKVTEIISPGTKLNDISPFDTNMIMVVYFDELKSRKTGKLFICLGVCFLDLTCGKSYISEINSTENDSTYALDELYKYILLYTPREIILSSSSPISYSYSKLVSYLDIGSGKCIHDKLNKYPEQMNKNAYQDQLLRKVFPNHGLLSPHEYLDLEFKPNASLAFVYMLDFCYKHNEKVLKNLSNPIELLPQTKYCTIAYNAANQLELHYLAIKLNKCRTAMGRRSFKERLASPLICPDEINYRYDCVAAFIELLKNVDSGKVLTKHLDNIYDVERLYRLICIQKLHPADWSQVLTTINTVRELNKYNKESKILHFSKAGSAKALCDDINSVIDINIAQKFYLTNITDNFFIKGAYPELDKLQAQCDADKNIFKEVMIWANPEFFKVEYTDRDGYYLQITKKRYDSIKSKLLKLQELNTNNMKFSWADFEVRANLSTLKCSCPQFNIINKRIVENKDELCKQILLKYREYLLYIADKYKVLFTKVTDYIINIDWYYSCAKNAIDNRYFRPEILKNPEKDNSYLNAKNIRHPIIEQILTHEQYVPNDIELDSSGILLYGVNSSGKSSLSKAVALTIIMAQTGMYCPANLVYWPYNEIFTRIPSGDNLMKSQSTFIVEISEISNILRRATKNSLVIGDELASGTESISALAIVGAGINQLCKIGTSFIFATHLHELTKISIIKELSDTGNLNIYHLSIEYDEIDGKLIYDRKLAPGQGDTIYGLEVCKSVMYNIEFMNCANQIRHEILGDSDELCKSKKSRYNSSVFVDICAICGVSADEVHHIQLQKFADEQGFIGTIHKNHKSNLIPICEKCHDNIHNDKIKIDGYKQTTKGIKLIYKNI
jgi:DNA mismatch repair protein MutS